LRSQLNQPGNGLASQESFLEQGVAFVEQGARIPGQQFPLMQFAVKPQQYVVWLFGGDGGLGISH
jgi:hypothetical protein